MSVPSGDISRPINLSQAKVESTKSWSAKVTEFLSAESIAQVNQRLGQEITAYYQSKNTSSDLSTSSDLINRPLIVVGMLRGSFVFMADLVREIQLPLITDFMTVSSYGDKTQSSGDVRIVMDLGESIQDCDVLVVEDIVDTGNTLVKVLDRLRARHPHSLKVCALLNKPSRRVVEVPIDFCGIEIEDHFVVGYGLDLAQKYRNLPYIGLYSEA